MSSAIIELGMRFHIIESDVPDNENQNDLENDDSVSIQVDLTSNENRNESINATMYENSSVLKDFRSKRFHELKSLAHEKQIQVNQRLEQVLKTRHSSKEKLSTAIHMDNFHYPELFVN
ncbi:unnamed protein product [Adineta ricciae]|uniref:Uncharacterized protein n=1 Tax=Adineta ricciae TaxID=249248 RepID=A0A814NXB1_ADIRI|nr:unnamed protein product [Adineta ricciae]CAF1340581.1 unnamed protein product [Adineta ricciae]